MKKSLKIEGMHCDHCKSRVETVLSELDGVDSVKVNLRKGTASISSKAEIDEEKIRNAVNEIGFSVSEIK